MKNFYEITYKDCNKETCVMGVAAETMSMRLGCLKII